MAEEKEERREGEGGEGKTKAGAMLSKAGQGLKDHWKIAGVIIAGVTLIFVYLQYRNSQAGNTVSSSGMPSADPNAVVDTALGGNPTTPTTGGGSGGGTVFGGSGSGGGSDASSSPFFAAGQNAGQRATFENLLGSIRTRYWTSAGQQAARNAAPGYTAGQQAAQRALQQFYAFHGIHS